MRNARQQRTQDETTAGGNREEVCRKKMVGTNNSNPFGLFALFNENVFLFKNSTGERGADNTFYPIPVSPNPH